VLNQNLLRGKIVSCGLTQGHLAKKLNMTENTFSKKMRTGSFTIAQVDCLCEALRIDSPEEKCEIFLPCVSQK
jgi:hypothetical protein